MVGVEDLIAGHHRHQILCFRQIDDVVGPAGDHVDSLDFIAGNLKLHRFSSIDVPLLNQAVASDHDKQFPLGVVPVLAFGNTGLRDIDAHLSTVSSVYQFGKRNLGCPRSS